MAMLNVRKKGGRITGALTRPHMTTNSTSQETKPSTAIRGILGECIIVYDAVYSSLEFSYEVSGSYITNN